MRAGALIYRPTPRIPSDRLCKTGSSVWLALWKAPRLRRGWGSRCCPLLLHCPTAHTGPAGLGGLAAAGLWGRRGAESSSRGSGLGWEHAGCDSLGEACPTAPSAVPILRRNPRRQCHKRGWGTAAFSQRLAGGTEPARPGKGMKPGGTRKKTTTAAGGGTTRTGVHLTHQISSARRLSSRFQSGAG